MKKTIFLLSLTFILFFTTISWVLKDKVGDLA